MNEPKPQPNSRAPYTELGTHLRYLREQQKESLAEVSGAVEIAVENLERIEQGHERPAEDILLLLISHFGIADKEAGQLWDLAGYDQIQTKSQTQELKMGAGQMLMVLALDMRTLYSDLAEAHATDSGLVINFSQQVGSPGAQPQPVARIGMSLEQARKVIATLEQAILRAEYLNGPKQLPHPDQETDKNDHLK